MERHVTINGTEFWIDPENLIVELNGKTYEKDCAEKLAKELLKGRLKLKVAEREITFLGEILEA